MVTLHFHPFGRHDPHAVFKIEFPPKCAQRFLAAHGSQDREFERAGFNVIAK